MTQSIQLNRVELAPLPNLKSHLDFVSEPIPNPEIKLNATTSHLVQSTNIKISMLSISRRGQSRVRFRDLAGWHCAHN